MSSPTPLTPSEIDEILKPDLRTLAADMLALRDGLDRMNRALAKLAAALGTLDAAAARMAGRD